MITSDEQPKLTHKKEITRSKPSSSKTSTTEAVALRLAFGLALCVKNSLLNLLPWRSLMKKQAIAERFLSACPAGSRTSAAGPKANPGPIVHQVGFGTSRHISNCNPFTHDNPCPLVAYGMQQSTSYQHSMVQESPGKCYLLDERAIDSRRSRYS